MNMWTKTWLDSRPMVNQVKLACQQARFKCQNRNPPGSPFSLEALYYLSINFSLLCTTLWSIFSVFEVAWLRTMGTEGKKILKHFQSLSLQLNFLPHSLPFLPGIPINCMLVGLMLSHKSLELSSLLFILFSCCCSDGISSTTLSLNLLILSPSSSRFSMACFRDSVFC